jgi:hypothetical protein
MKNNKKKGVSLIEIFRFHSHEIDGIYHRQLHKDKDFLKEKGFSPKNKN